MGSSSIGIPEVVVILVLLGFYVIPIGAGIWAVITLRRLQTGQEAIRQRLDAIERALQRPAG